MLLIALSGGAGTGKDYIHEKVLRPLGFHRVSLADHFKMALVGRGQATYPEVHETKPPHIRRLLQEEGTERGRNVYGENVWCQTLGAWLLHWERTWGMDKFCITDVRFPNEVKFVQEVGGQVFRVVAPGRYSQNKMSEEARKHPSETALEGYDGFNGLIYNDYDDEDYREQVFALLVDYGVLASAHRPLSLVG